MSLKIGGGYSKYVDENWIISVPTDYVPHEKGVGDLLFQSMKKYKNNIAQYVFNTDEEDTYGELLERCIRTSLHLREQYNFNKDDIIMLCSENRKNSCVPFLASVFLGIQIASLDPTLSVLDMTHFLKEVHPKILFVVPEILEAIEQSLSEAGVATEIVVFGKSDKYKSFHDFLKPHKNEETFVPISVKSLEDPMLIVFSSGTSGMPKGIVLNQYTVGAQIHNVVKHGFGKTVTLFYSSLYWISAILFLSTSILTGTARVLCTHYDSKQIWHIIEKYKVTISYLSPIQATDMLAEGPPNAVDTSSLEVLTTGGAPVSDLLIKNLRDLFPGTIVGQGYGQSEVAGLLTGFNYSNISEAALIYKKPTSIGTPVTGFSYKVVNPLNESACGPYEQGELRIKSKIMMNGYYKRDSSETFDSDGWLRTGDIVYFDEDVCFYIVDRIKEMLKYKAWHVSPAMVEMILSEHLAVSQVVVIGIPHPEDGDHPMALIVPTDHYKNKISEEEIKNFIVQKAPDRMKLRGGVKFLDSLPVTPTGKIKRKEIRDMVLKGQL